MRALITTRIGDGEHGLSSGIRRSLTSAPRAFVRVTMVVVLLCACELALAETWKGQPLSEILQQLRSAGLPLIYSSQVVTPELRIAAEPIATDPLDRLREALKPF